MSLNRFETTESLLATAIYDLAILSGDAIGPSGASWQDVAGTASVNLRALANFLDSLRQGETHHQGVPIDWDDGCVVFPSPFETADKVSSGELKP